jgi:carboxylesterase type B
MLTSKNYLFNRAIIQSAFFDVSYVKPARLIPPSLDLAKQAGCLSTSSDAIISCLQSVDSNTLQKISETIFKKGDTTIGPSIWSPNSDFINENQVFNGDVLRGFDQNEIEMFIPYYELKKYFYSNGQLIYSNFKSYDNNYVNQVLTESMLTDYRVSPACINNLYSKAFLKDDYSGTIDYNLKPSYSREAMNLAWYGKISKILGDLATNCPAIDFNSTVKINGQNYLYKFNYLSAYDAYYSYGLVLHCAESYYVFGDDLRLKSSYSTDADKLMTFKVMNYWANFAKTGKLYVIF